MTNFSEEKNRIDGLLSSGKISAEEHQLLSKAIGGSVPEWKRAFNLAIRPFGKISSATALGVGFFDMLIMCWFAVPLAIYFPGALDLQIQRSKASATYVDLVLQNFVAVFALMFMYFACALLYKKRNLRLIDFAGFVFFARLPYTIFVVAMALMTPFVPGLIPVPGAPPVLSVGSGILAGFATVAMIWYLMLLFSALREASGLSGSKLWISFIGGTVAAEIISILINTVVLS